MKWAWGRQERRGVCSDQEQAYLAIAGKKATVESIKSAWERGESSALSTVVFGGEEEG